MNRRALVIAVLLAVGVGIGAVALLKRVVPAATEAAGRSPIPTRPVAPAPAVAVPGATRADEAPPPWASGATDAPASAPMGDAGPADPQRDAHMLALRRSVDGLVRNATERSQDSHVRLREALDALQALDDPRVNAQINLPALRQNLEISVRMQALTREFQQALAQPASPERDARVEAITRQFRTLQSQLRLDVSTGAAPATAPARVPPPAVPAQGAAG